MSVGSRRVDFQSDRSSIEFDRFFFMFVRENIFIAPDRGSLRVRVLLSGPACSSHARVRSACDTLLAGSASADSFGKLGDRVIVRKFLSLPAKRSLERPRTRPRAIELHLRKADIFVANFLHKKSSC